MIAQFGGDWAALLAKHSKHVFPLKQEFRASYVILFSILGQPSRSALPSHHFTGTLPDFTLQFQIETDASEGGVGAVLMQRGHPLTCISKSLGPKSRGLST
jgi:hypothetical protein